MAARSDRLTARPLRPRASGCASAKSGRPSVNMSVLVARCRPPAKRNRAQSSPTPRYPDGAGREKYRAMRSNSLSNGFGLAARGRLNLGWADIGRHFVEHAIYKLEAVSTAKGFGQLDRFVDGNLIWHFEVVYELEAADQQNAVLDRRKLFERAVDIRHEALAQCRRFTQHTVQQGFEPRGIGFAELVVVSDMRVDLAGVLQAGIATQQPGVNPLERKLARPPPRAAAIAASRSAGRRCPCAICRQDRRPRPRRPHRRRRSRHRLRFRAREQQRGWPFRRRCVRSRALFLRRALVPALRCQW